MLLELESVTKSYPTPGSDTTSIVLAQISLKVGEAERVGVVGPSGCGKSTLLNLIGALDHPTSGLILLDGVDLAHQSERDLARIRNEKLGFVFQSHHLLPQCTALENVLIPVLVGHASAQHEVERARDLLDRVGLGNRLNYRPGQLSGGECQRVAVVRALINQPRLVLADEPTGSLDEGSASRLSDLLVEINEQHGVALITVTHSADLADRMGKVFRLHRGALMPDGARPDSGS